MDDGAGQWPVPAPGYGGVHDLGGVDNLLGVPVDTTDRAYSAWERNMHALLVLVVKLRLMTVDELRLGIERLQPAQYAAWGYYDKWAVSTATGLLERGVITAEELDAALGNAVEARDDATVSPPRFQPGDTVQVKHDRYASRWRKPHLRVPGYVFGATGVVSSYNGVFGDPEFLAFRGADWKQHLYTVNFDTAAIWPEHTRLEDHDAPTTIGVEVYQSWLQPPDGTASLEVHVKHDCDGGHAGHDHAHHSHAHHDHGGHGHAHGDHGDHGDHDHGTRADVERQAVEAEAAESPGQRVAEALARVLAEKGLISPNDVRVAVERIDMTGTRGEGPKIVAKAWVDNEFRKLLLADANEACASIGIGASNSTTATRLRAVECTDDTHCLVVCTLCSCYPLSILGLSPPWYKSREFRARAVREPRAMLRDSFGLSLPNTVNISVFDSTADMRYIVIPKRPPGTEGWTEEQLRTLVTRDSMIGVAQPSV